MYFLSSVGIFLLPPSLASRGRLISPRPLRTLPPWKTCRVSHMLSGSSAAFSD